VGGETHHRKIRPLRRPQFEKSWWLPDIRCARKGDPHPSSASEVRLPNELRSRTVQREWLLVAAGGTGEQVIVVLDGTRDAPGTCVWRPPSSSAGPDGQAAAVAAGLPVRTWLIKDSHDDTSDGS
jgi:hypothetical protein